MLNAPRHFPKRPAKTLIIGLLLAGLCVSMSACEMKLPPMPWDPKPDPKAAAQKDGKNADANAAGDEQANAGGGEDEAESGPVDELSLLPADMKTLPYEEVSIPLHDQLIIYGRLYDPKMKPEGEDTGTDESGDDYKGPKYPLVILLHGLNHTHVAWSDLPASLVKAGYAVFAMDLRGHGKSSITTHKHRVAWRLFKPEDWQKLSKDVNEVMQYFQKGEDYPEVDGKTVALVGEKLGANVAVYAARDMHDSVKAMILISPGLDYKGIIPSQAIVDYTNPALLITSQDDDYSYQSTERLYNWLLGPKALQVYKKIGDGTDMLTNRTSLGSQMTDWLVNHFPPVAGAPATADSPATEKSADANAPSDKAATPAKKDDSKAASDTEKPAEKP